MNASRSNLMVTSTDKRQERSKKRKDKQWLKWLCNRRTFRLLIQLGPAIFNLLRLLIEAMQFFSD